MGVLEGYLLGREAGAKGRQNVDSGGQRLDLKHEYEHDRHLANDEAAKLQCEVAVVEGLPVEVLLLDDANDTYRRDGRDWDAVTLRDGTEMALTASPDDPVEWNVTVPPGEWHVVVRIAPEERERVAADRTPQSTVDVSWSIGRR